MIAVGMDLGAKAIKIVVLSDKGLCAKVKFFPDLDLARSAKKALEEALIQAGAERHEVKGIAAAGTGRSAAPGSPVLVTEPLADAKGTAALFPQVHTVIDVGAEEGRGVRITPQGEVVDFAVNEKCAAGSGAFMESMARSLELNIDQFGSISLKANQAVPMNAQCTVFAESEVVSLIHANTPKSDIARAVHDAAASRIAAMTRRVGIEKEVALIGGTAYNPGFVDALKRALSIEALLIPNHPDFIGALGAALIACEHSESIKLDFLQLSSQWETVPAHLFTSDGKTENMTAAESVVEHWKWPEQFNADLSQDWKKATRITAGIDVGSVSSQAVVLLDGKLYAWSSVRTGSSSPDSAKKALDQAIKNTDLPFDKISYVVGTGYGRVNVPFAKKTITEIACHARGANYMGGGTIRTILDMGGQDCKAIHCDEKGKVTNFLMNDKCAAGTGRGMEVLADLLRIPIQEIGPMSLTVQEEPPPVSSVCVVFAKTEAIGLLKSGWPVEKVLASYCLAMAERVTALLNRIGVEKDFFITGGIAKNIGVVKRIERILGINALNSSLDSQIAGALGAALFANALLEKEWRGKS